MMIVGWTDEEVSFARKLWIEGASAGAIVNKLQGKSRNAVIGKMHRLGLSKRQTIRAANANAVKGARIRRKRASIRYVPNRVIMPCRRDLLRSELAQIAAMPPLEPGKSISDLREGQCRYINGDPDIDATVCGRATAGGPWCVLHRKLVYVPSAPKARTRTHVDDERRRQMERERWAEGVAA